MRPPLGDTHVHLIRLLNQGGYCRPLAVVGLTYNSVHQPLPNSAILLLVLVIIQLLTKVHNWRSALISALMATSFCLVMWKCRSEMWLVFVYFQTSLCKPSF
jgi:hypothetical protein